MPYSYWVVFLDLTLAGFLLLLGAVIRTRVGIVQRLFLPANFLAGGIGLALGPNGFGYLPFSLSIAEYPGLFAALIFATLPFTSAPIAAGGRSLPVVQLGLYSAVAIFLQWSLAIGFTSLVLRPLWPSLPDGFASLLALGFIGGYGTAAAVGATFSEYGWSTGQSLAMVSATMGLLTSIVGGMALIRWGTRSGVTTAYGHCEIPSEGTDIHQGLAENRSSPGSATTGMSSLNVLSLHLSLILIPTLAGYILNHESAVYLKGYRIPIFCLSFLAAGVLSRLLRLVGATSYIDRATAQTLQGMFVDFLVVFSIASISFLAVAAHLFPLLLLLSFGTLLCLWLFLYLGPRSFSAFWFENALFTWGWITGIMGIAVALLQIVDPQHRSRVLHHFAVAYVFILPIEIFFVVLGPLLLLRGKGLLLSAITGVAAVATLIALFYLRRQSKQLCRLE